MSKTLPSSIGNPPSEMLEMDDAGDEFRLITLGIEINLQPMEALDLEQKGNVADKLIHKMWKKLAATKSNWTGGSPDLIVRRRRASA